MSIQQLRNAVRAAYRRHYRSRGVPDEAIKRLVMPQVNDLLARSYRGAGDILYASQTLSNGRQRTTRLAVSYGGNLFQGWQPLFSGSAHEATVASRSPRPR